MINKVAKGTRKEKACEDELIAQGYLTWRVIRNKWHSLDLFGYFDVCGLASNGSHLRFIQTKSNRCDTKTRDAIAKLKMPLNCRKEIWIWKDRKYWVKEFYD